MTNLASSVSAAFVTALFQAATLPVNMALTVVVQSQVLSGMTPFVSCRVLRRTSRVEAQQRSGGWTQQKRDSTHLL